MKTERLDAVVEMTGYDPNSQVHRAIKAELDNLKRLAKTGEFHETVNNVVLGGSLRRQRGRVQSDKSYQESHFPYGRYFESTRDRACGVLGAVPRYL
jgi:hypothetical protein